MSKRPKVIYLASPYTHQDASVKEQRYIEITKFAAKVYKVFRHALILPITMSHAMAIHDKDLDGAFAEWESVDKEYILRSDEVWVYCMDGWDKSVGVTEEIRFAKSEGIPVVYIRPETQVLTAPSKHNSKKVKS